MQKYFIIAGELSGDLHGGHLMKEMLALNPNICFEGIGGPLMQKQGLSSLVSLDKMAVMGFFEVLKKYSFFKSLQNSLLKKIESSNAKNIILIDYPGFNLRLAKKIKMRFPKTSVYYYISPQIWAWKENRINIVKKYIDKMIVLFDFEKKWYDERGVKTTLVGHPFLDYYKSTALKSEARKSLGLNKNKKYLTLFPGSREQEIKNHLPIMLQALKNNFFKDFEVLIGQAKGLNNNIVDLYDLGQTKVVSDAPEHALAAADFAWVGSGTSSLESVMFNTPFILVYKTSPLSWFLMKKYVKVKYAGMPNIIINQPLVPELLQESFSCKNLILETKTLLNSQKNMSRLLQGYDIIRKKLGATGASKRAAQCILNVEN